MANNNEKKMNSSSSSSSESRNICGECDEEREDEGEHNKKCFNLFKSVEGGENGRQQEVFCPVTGPEIKSGSSSMKKRSAALVFESSPIRYLRKLLFDEREKIGEFIVRIWEDVPMCKTLAPRALMYVSSFIWSLFSSIVSQIISSAMSLPVASTLTDATVMEAATVVIPNIDPSALAEEIADGLLGRTLIFDVEYIRQLMINQLSSSEAAACNISLEAASAMSSVLEFFVEVVLSHCSKYPSKKFSYWTERVQCPCCSHTFRAEGLVKMRIDALEQIDSGYSSEVGKIMGIVNKNLRKLFWVILRNRTLTFVQDLIRGRVVVKGFITKAQTMMKSSTKFRRWLVIQRL